MRVIACRSGKQFLNLLDRMVRAALVFGLAHKGGESLVMPQNLVQAIDQPLKDQRSTIASSTSLRAIRSESTANLATKVRCS